MVTTLCRRCLACRQRRKARQAHAGGLLRLL